MSTDKFLDKDRFRLLSKVRIVRFIHKQKSGYYDRMTKKAKCWDTIIDCLNFTILRTTVFQENYYFF
jgi:hypothetical protein